MPVSGLVVSLKSDPQLREQTIAAIRNEKRIEIGVVQSHRMAIVLDTASLGDDKLLWCWLSSLPGVIFVDVADPDDPLATGHSAASAATSGNSANPRGR